MPFPQPTCTIGYFYICSFIILQHDSQSCQNKFSQQIASASMRFPKSKTSGPRHRFQNQLINLNISVQYLQLNQFTVKYMAGFQLFNDFTEQLRQIENLSQKLEHYEDSFALRRYRISQISTKEALTLLENIEKKFYKFYAKGSSGIWFQNQLRLFVWILICYMELRKKHIRQFTAQDWLFFSSILYIKNPILFQYQAKITLDYSLCLRKWSSEEDGLLTKIVLEAKKVKWNQIAKILFHSSHGQFTRTSKQCRQRWLNHLDPSKTKLSWSLSQCKILLQLVIEKGKKWASLVQFLNGRRSQHSIKNKYNSMLIKQKKFNHEFSQSQNCQILIEKIESIVLGGQISTTDEQIFGESIRILKQNDVTLHKESQESGKQKLTKSQDMTLSVRSNNELGYSLNFDDLFEKQKQMQFSTSKGRMLQKLRKTKNRKSMERSLQFVTQNQQNGDQMFIEESLISLDQLKLVIRESELDR